ncbi:xanthine dehydrogenase family protein molybdopterin-binding subunit [Phyllobacterium sp. 628]|uniref:xanthine dehydrogenase family protein molybdopterin-binding subunit n=1 Tax=Phyllobacterium sp. 628 TaxID=2718938 RepID=UPI00166237C2|nr:xanthine dehydrogenase family protein molybdopterin-binding subunit [Phyllobacterium sp. 628]QND53714.1 xanthine dehydrogenase family protein molybdopterin-binding subunit [Phyllobacterium sp. 628]
MSKPSSSLSEKTSTSRRTFLQGSGLLLGFALFGAGTKVAHAETTAQPVAGDVTAAFSPDAFIRIGSDGKITLILPNIEMGQGTHTGEATLIAEELEVGLDQVKVVDAPPNDKLYATAALGGQATGGSTSMRATWESLRKAGATARMMLVSAAAAQWSVPVAECSAKAGVVTHQASGRSLAYGELAQAAATQPVPASVTLKDPKDFQLIGKSSRRLDTPGKVNGAVVYGIDVRVPDMKVATVAACPVIGGKLGDVDEKAARAIPGVRDIVRLDNAVAVIGDHFWAAKKGLEALTITWNEGANANLTSANIMAALKAASERKKPIMARQEGDVEGTMKAASKKVEAIYHSPFLAHAPMEPINCVVHVRADECEIWVGTQVPTMAQGAAAQVTGFPLDKIILHNHLIGGGFGRRLVAESVAQAVAIAKQVSYPVKVIWTREEDIQHDLYRPAYYDHISAALGADGLPTAWVERIAGGSVLGNYLPSGWPEGKLDDDAVEGAAKPPYDLPVIQVDWVREDPPVPITWWRGVGPTHNVFVVESFMDELAHAAGKDPVEYRRALTKNQPRAAGVLELVAEKSGWGTPLAKGMGRGIALHDAFGSYMAAVLEISVSPTGEITLHRAVVAVDCGITINPNTVEAQIEGGLIFGLSAALYSGITFTDGRVDQSNFHDYRILRNNEAPKIEIHHVKSLESPGGIGETATVSAAPVLANAIFSATGKRLRTLPFNRDELKTEGIEKKSVSMVLPIVAPLLAALASTKPTDAELEKQ